MKIWNSAATDQEPVMHRPHFPTVRFQVAAGLSLALAGFAAADVVYMKDGFPLYGKVKREMELISDPATGQVIPIVKGGSSFLLNDGARYIIVSHKQIQTPDNVTDIRDGFVILQMPFARGSPRGRPGLAE